MRKLIITCVLGLLALHLQAQVSVEQRIDSVEILIGEQTYLDVNVTAQRGQRVEFPSYQRSEMLTPGVEVLEQSGVDTTHLDNNRVRLTRKYLLTSFEDTLYYIPPVEVKVDGQVFQGKSIALKVLDMPVDTLHPNQFFGPQSVQENPFLWSDWSAVFWLSLLIVVLCLAGYYLFVRLRDNKPIVSRIKIIRHIPAHQKALTEIERIKSQGLGVSGDQKEYYTKLTDTLRRYIQERFGINAMEMTSSEIIDHLQKEKDQRKLNELREVFATADLVKFAKHSALLNENDMNLTSVVEFIDETKLGDQPIEEKVTPQLSETDKRTVRSRIVLKTLIGLTVVLIVGILSYVLWQIVLLVG